MPTILPTSAATSRIRRYRAIASSSEPWASPMRATSMPASIIRRRVSGESDAGPMVATILVRRGMHQRYARRGYRPAHS